MNIETLLAKYFEGETTCEEERELRQFFAKGIVPEQLNMYRPMFAFFEAEKKVNEREKQAIEAPPPIAPARGKQRFSLHHALLYSLSGIAVGFLLLLSITGINHSLNAKPESYVIIDGKQYTDATLIRQQATAAFEEVSLNEEEMFAALFE
ncbi:hypothetical protein [Bacteroides sp.]|uniref:hypothetical protein n=1 Tax=Bacteroides sp. TaxID=29523 RepID=UPI001B51EF50|nr:hypothetical protein [Bacteroides sp.]MBP6064620.1 hypothetical protein [Bacteroides sp.]MBP6066961.1 hypothetical protein [Bacteroides sp.]MBP6935845.1 hypothetical protein [Bacteroides sp.]MBP8622239.1 hypothetical protein [Bacteroides sp.]MBP9585554.1 hypothetical protein [Bacteroides sp.]